MAAPLTRETERALRLLEGLSPEARFAALSYLEYLAALDEPEPPLTVEEREAILRFRGGDVSGLVPASGVWPGDPS
jgi:hypothetical protein